MAVVADAQGDRLLAPVLGEELAALPWGHEVAEAVGVAVDGLDLDDPGAAVGQLGGAERHDDELAELDDGEARRTVRRPGRPSWDVGDAVIARVAGGGWPARRRPTAPVDRDVAQQELDDGLAEDVVAIAGDHVGGAGDVDVLGVRAQPQELLGPFLGQDVGQAAAHEQRRQPRGSGRTPRAAGGAPRGRGVRARKAGSQCQW